MSEAFCLNQTQRDELEHCYSGLDLDEEERRSSPCRILGLNPDRRIDYDTYILLRAAMRGELHKLLGSIVKGEPKGTEIQPK